MNRQVSRNQADGKKTDLCFLYCDVQQRGSNSIGRRNDQHAMSQIRMNLEDKGLTCAIARLPTDPAGERYANMLRARRCLYYLLELLSL